LNPPLATACVEEYRIRNDRAGKHGVTRDHPETTGASSGCSGSGVHNKTPPTIKAEVG
jgi:hypothetical protein